MANNFAVWDARGLKIAFEFKRKLWQGDNNLSRMNNISKMLKIDNSLINLKLSSFEDVPRINYRWPLAFSLPSEKVENILNQHGVSCDENKNILKMGTREVVYS